MKPAEYPSFYATKFDTVEVDSTFYATPALATVQGWYRKTPANFVCALKVPQIITHEKALLNCDEEFVGFYSNGCRSTGETRCNLVSIWIPKSERVFPSQARFLRRLIPFLRRLPTGFKFAVEIRNEDWFDETLANVRRACGVALAMTDQSWVPRPWEMKNPFDMRMSDFLYVRLLGDGKGIEAITTVWEKVVVDREGDIQDWLKYLRPIVRKGERSYVYCNNHYAGFGPATAGQFLNAWRSA
jgi:uncharacterized protein YecE (DUF72 family)